MMNFGPHISTLLESTRAALHDIKFCGPKFKNKKVMGCQILTNIPIFFEIGELWSTYFDTFEKPSGRATRAQNFVGQSLKTAEIWRWGRKPETPTFPKLMNFCPRISTLLESPRAGLHDHKILCAKVQKRRRYRVGGEIRKISNISKTSSMTPMEINAIVKWGHARPLDEIWENSVQ